MAGEKLYRVQLWWREGESTRNTPTPTLLTYLVESGGKIRIRARVLEPERCRYGSAQHERAEFSATPGEAWARFIRNHRAEAERCADAAIEHNRLVKAAEEAREDRWRQLELHCDVAPPARGHFAEPLVKDSLDPPASPTVESTP